MKILDIPVNTLSYGVVGLNILKELSSKEDVALFPIGGLEVLPQYEQLVKTCIENAAHIKRGKHNVLRIFHQFNMNFGLGGKRIGFPIFELSQFTQQEKAHLSSLDTLIVCSEWAKQVCVDNGVQDSENIVVAPLGVDRAIFNEQIPHLRDLEPLIAQNTTIFLSSGKWEKRKGHDVLVEAFNKAFTPADNVILLVSAHNPFLDPKELQNWLSLYQNSPMGKAAKINILGGRLPNQETLASLMRTVDCGVFPARAEGWNLELLEMMSVGKPVICTNYSGHTQFATKENALLIEVDTLEDAWDDKWFFGQGQWAHFGDSQMEQLITHLRNIHSAKQQNAPGRSLLNPPGIETAKKFTWSNAANIVAKLL